MTLAAFSIKQYHLTHAETHHPTTSLHPYAITIQACTSRNENTPLER